MNKLLNNVRATFFAWTNNSCRCIDRVPVGFDKIAACNQRMLFDNLISKRLNFLDLTQIFDLFVSDTDF